jgi:hypothetical protein
MIFIKGSSGKSWEEEAPAVDDADEPPVAAQCFAEASGAMIEEIGFNCEFSSR